MENNFSSTYDGGLRRASTANLNGSISPDRSVFTPLNIDDSVHQSRWTPVNFDDAVRQSAWGPLVPKDAPVGAGNLTTGGKNQNSSEYRSANLLSTFITAALYSAVQAPLDGVTQLGNQLSKTIGSDVKIPSVHICSAPESGQFLSGQWFASTFGGGVGTIIPFLALSGATDWALGGFKSSSNAIAIEKITKATLTSSEYTQRFALKGAIYEGVFHPTDPGKNFWAERLINTTAGGASFYVMGALPDKLISSRINDLSLGQRVYQRGVAGSIAGAASGVVDTGIHAVAHGQLPNLQEMTEQSVQYAILGGAFLGGREYTDLLKPRKAPAPKVEFEIRKSERTSDEMKAFDPSIAKTVDPTIKKVADAITADPFRVFIESHKSTTTDLGRIKYSVPKDAPELSDLKKVMHGDQEYFVTAKGNVYQVTPSKDGNLEFVHIDDLVAVALDHAQAPWTPINSNNKNDGTN